MKTLFYLNHSLCKSLNYR